MMRALYSALVYLALPFLPLRLWWRGRKEPGYREHIGERFGRYAGIPTARPPVLWIHAVSLGETHASVPLVEHALRSYPAATILVTHMTATGRAAGRSLFGERVVQAWLPYDAPLAVRAFLAHWKPAAGVLMETELWPNVVAFSAAAGVPLFLVNARLSARSAAGYSRVRSLARPMLASLTGVAAQAEADAARLAALGARAPVVTGNLKFDLEAPAGAQALGREFKVLFGAQRPVFVAASTRDGEEGLIADALQARPLPAETLTVIVPRHPQRFDAVADLLRARRIPFVRRSDNAAVPIDVGVVLGDSMGELGAYYSAADVAFVGGSLLPLGGQNLIEPIAAGSPTIVGPHTFNFAEATRTAIAAGAALEVADATALIGTVAALIEDPARRLRMHAAAIAFHAAHRGAAERLWAWLAPQLPQALRTSASSTSPSAGG
jgi:3-deoxy-D-manno-octulosonic-acid transferase